MGRNAGRKLRLRTVTERIAVAEAAIRQIDTAADLLPGEVLLVRVRVLYKASTLTSPVPPPIAFEIWRLIRHKRMSFGQVARLPVLVPRLAPKLTSRLTETKRYVAKVDRFLKTSHGLAFTIASWWPGWLETGTADPTIALLQDIEREQLEVARLKVISTGRR